MRLITRSLGTLVTTLLVLVVLLPQPSFAQDDDDVRQSVARVAFLSGSASFNRGDDPENWEEAVVNYPMTLGDRLYTARDGRAELQARGARIFLGPESELAALDFRDDLRQLSLTVGTASFRINRLSEDEVFEVDTPNVSLTFRSPGTYRIDVDSGGNTFASVFEGLAVAAAAGGEVDLETGDAIRVDGLDESSYDVVALPRTDPWDRWVEERSRLSRNGISVRYASSDIVGLDDLDHEGEWQQIPDYGWVWGPPVTVGSWAPYQLGRWGWQDPWGWTWISQERWGWAPYHYGSWITWNDRWFWVPVPRSVQVVRYAPARVVFSGGGPGWASGGSVGAGGFVGWFPIGPRDRFVPWWGRRVSVGATVRDVPFMNRRFLTVMNRDAFAGGRFVEREMVRDPRVIRQVSASALLTGPIPVVPTAGSLRISQRVGLGAVVRPPRVVESRAVVTRLAPPPAPLPFQTKMGLITQSHGMPVSRVSAEKVASEVHGQPRTVVNIRPAVPGGGKVLLVPKRELVETRRVRPATAPENKPLSTVGRPSVGAPVQLPPGRDVQPRPDDAGPAKRYFEKPVDRAQPERRDIQPRPDTRPVVKPDIKPEIKPDTKPVQRNLDRPIDQGRPERLERLPRPEVKPPDRAPVVVQPQPKVEPKPQPVQRVDTPQPAPRVEKPQSARKVEKPTKPEEVRKDKDRDKDKKDR
jgi:hypothetical protein